MHENVWCFQVQREQSDAQSKQLIKSNQKINNV